MHLPSPKLAIAPKSVSLHPTHVRSLIHQILPIRSASAGTPPNALILRILYSEALLAALSLVPLKGRPGWNRPRVRGACPLATPPGIPPMHMPFRDTPYAALHEIVMVNSLPESRIANRRGQNCSPKPWPQSFEFLRHVPTA